MKCRNGHTVSSLSGFYVRADGSRFCKKCQAESNRRWRAKNPEKNAEYVRAFRARRRAETAGASR